MFAEVKNGYVHKDAVPMKTVKLTEALAVAYAAYATASASVRGTVFSGTASL